MAGALVLGVSRSKVRNGTVVEVPVVLFAPAVMRDNLVRNISELHIADIIHLPIGLYAIH
jgi:hypothetical protein